jgi:hypothetical protein
VCRAPAIPSPQAASDLWRLLDQHFETVRQVYEERFAAKYGAEADLKVEVKPGRKTFDFPMESN